MHAIYSLFLSMSLCMYNAAHYKKEIMQVINLFLLTKYLVH
jgi:hypothetical protein